MLGPAEYRKALEAARDEWHSKNHPFFKTWAKGELSNEAMRAYCQQHYNFVSNASRYSGIMYGLCDWHDARVLLLENLNEEEDPEERHVDLLARFGMALGMTFEESRSAPDLPTTAALKDFIINTLMMKSVLEGIATLTIGLESQVPDLYRPLIDPLRNVYGFTDADIEFFTLHVVADVEHGDAGFEIIINHSTDERDQQMVIDQVRAAAMKRWFYMDGLWLQYVEGRQWYPASAPAAA
ncbi:MAG: hypothetical protein F4Z00_01735 [Acidimicrobiaceae bacterium]|nr:iron-containing redox enzyme family protein [Acidimicrobiaceae bacterium]MDE0667015.1 iron-containing redox enzyme family protein [Acidimicrobiaceae bacterium]MXY11093.1 hypothetical protein [Acidimicrobiaceae bacterium]MXZ64259.1 hypothetical protein [Acidimicrobiaceae bacterium]MYF34881.1 hypothetical protein [Acidimicrobiaceae bacterium]